MQYNDIVHRIAFQIIVITTMFDKQQIFFYLKYIHLFYNYIHIF